MRYKLASITAIVWSLSLLLCGAPGYAQTYPAYPDPNDTIPFTPEANYMSLYGYLRWQYSLSGSHNPWHASAAFLGTRQEFESRLKAKAKAAPR